MMKLGKVLLVAALLSSVVTTMSAQAASTTKKLVVQQLPLKFTFDQVQLAPAADQSGFSYNNMVYVPLRFASYALNKAVTWDGKNNAVEVSVPTKQQLIVIGEYNLNRQVRGAGTGTTIKSKPIALNVTVQKLNYVYVFDGVAKQPAAGQEGIIYKGTLYVPIRFFSQAMGKDVAWDAKTLTVAVSVNKGTDGETGSGTGTTNPGTTVPPTPLTVDQQAVNAFNSLKNSSEATFNSLFNQYMNAKTDEEKAKIKADGKAQLAAITSQFNALVATYQEKDASASVIDEAKKQFSLLSGL